MNKQSRRPGGAVLGVMALALFAMAGGLAAADKDECINVDGNGKIIEPTNHPEIQLSKRGQDKVHWKCCNCPSGSKFRVTNNGYRDCTSDDPVTNPGGQPWNGTFDSNWRPSTATIPSPPIHQHAVNWCWKMNYHYESPGGQRDVWDPHIRGMP